MGFMMSIGTWLKITSCSTCFGLYDIAEQTKVMYKADVTSAVEMKQSCSQLCSDRTYCFVAVLNSEL